MTEVEQEIQDAGSIQHDIAKKLAEQEFEKFRIGQDIRFESDFDKMAKKLPFNNKRKSGE